MCVCLPPLPLLLILPIVFSPHPPSPLSSYQSLPEGSREVSLWLVLELVEIPFYPPHKLQFCHRYINANIPSDPCQKPHEHPAECVASSPLKSQRETATSYRINFISKLRLK